MATYNIKPELARAFQSRFPNKASYLIENFIQNMLRSVMNERESELDDLLQKRELMSSKMQTLSSDLIGVEAQIEALETSIQQEREQSQQKLDAREIEFQGFKTHGNVEDFQTRFKFSKEKAEGVSEIDFYFNVYAPKYLIKDGGKNGKET